MGWVEVELHKFLVSVSGQFHAQTAAFFRHDQPHRMLDGPQSRPWIRGQETNLLHVSWVEPIFCGRPARYQVTIPTDKSRPLLYISLFLDSCSQSLDHSLIFLFSIAKGSIRYGVIRAYRFSSTVNPLNFVRKKIMPFSVQDQRVRFAGFSLQNEHHQIPAATKAPTHNELGTRRPMW